MCIVLDLPESRSVSVDRTTFRTLFELRTEAENRIPEAKGLSPEELNELACISLLVRRLVSVRGAGQGSVLKYRSRSSSAAPYFLDLVRGCAKAAGDGRKRGFHFRP